MYFRKKGEKLVYVALAFLALLVIILLLTTNTLAVPATSTTCGDVRTSLTLTANISAGSVTHNNPGTCFIINGSNLFLDGANFKVVGNRTGIGINITAISVNVSGNITIKNLVISNFTYGIFVINLSGSYFTNNTIFNNSRDGIKLENSTNNSLYNNTIYNNTMYGLFINITSDRNNITGNRLVDNYYGGIRLENSSYNLVGNNTLLRNNNSQLLLIDSPNNRLINNTVNDGSSTLPTICIRLTGVSNNNFLLYNTLIDCPINLNIDSDNNTISGNNLTTPAVASTPLINLSNSANNLIESNILEGITVGDVSGTFNIQYSIGTRIISNRITGFYGIRVEASNYSLISQNNITLVSNADSGVSIGAGTVTTPFSMFNNVTQNNINVTSASGISLSYNSSDTIVIGNNITIDDSGTDTVGIDIGVESRPGVNNSLIYGNFIEARGSGTAIRLNNDSGNNTFMNNTIVIGGAGFLILDKTPSTTANFFLYNSTFGEIRWTNNGTGSFLFNLTLNYSGNSLGIGFDRNIFISNNTIAFNTSAFGATSRINSSANLTLRGLTFRAFDQMRTVGNYTTTAAEIRAAGINCDGTSCENLSYDATNGILVFNTTGFSSFSAHDATPPQIRNFWMNATNNSNFSSSLASKLIFNASINDTATITEAVRFGFSNGNGTAFNRTGTLNLTLYSTELDVSTVTDGFYTVQIYANDSFNNVNNTVSNLSFTLDRTPPNVTQFLFNDSLGVLNASNFTRGGILSFNITVNDSTLTVETVKVGLTNDLRNGTQFNITLLRNFSGYHAAVAFNTLTDGFYTLRVYANDTLGNTNGTVANLSFRIDSTPPNVSAFYMSNLTNGSNVSGGVIFFNVSINDSTTFAKFASIGLTSLSNGTQFNVTLVRNFSGFHTPVVLSTMGDGFYTVQIYANDTLNNVNGTVANLSFTLDRAPPNVTQFLLNDSLGVLNASNFTNGGVLAFNITVNDSTLSVETVKVGLTNDFRNGTEFNVTLVKNFSGYHVAVAFNTLTDGFYTLKVYANDTVGNLNNTLTNLSFRVDLTPPNVTTFGMSNLTNASNLTGGIIFFNASVNDSTLTTETVRFNIFNDLRNSTSFNITAVKNFSWYQATLILSTMTDGSYTVTVLANDTVGNRNNSLSNVSFTIDRTPPNVTTFGMSNLTNGSNVSGGVIFFNVSINDSTTFARVASIGLTNDFRNGTEFNVTLARNFSGFHTALILSTMTDGFYTVRVYANDTVDNVNSSVANLSFTFDRTPPNVTQFLLNDSLGVLNASNFTNGGVVAFNLTINDSTLSVETVKVGLTNDFRNGTEFNVTLVKNFSGYHVAVAFSTLTDGFYTLKVYANDTVGNLNNTLANLSFRVDRTPPNVTQFLLNTSDLAAMNASNFTNGGILAFNITVNDSTLTVETVKVGLTNDLRNGTEFNITLLRNFSGYHAAVSFSTLTDGFYTLKVYANDTLNNANNTLANLSFRVDRTPPNVSSFGMNITTGASLSGASGTIQFNGTINDSTTSVQSVIFGFTNSVNLSQFNITTVKNESGGIYHILLQLNTLRCGAYTATAYANDTLGNLNNSVANLTFTIPCAEANPEAEASGGSSPRPSPPAAPASPAPSSTTSIETSAPVSTPILSIISIDPSVQISAASTAKTAAERQSSIQMQTVEVTITNNRSIELQLRPVIEEALPSLPLEEKYRDILRSELSRKNIPKAEEYQKIEEEIETLKHIEKQKANYLFGKAFSFGFILPKQVYSVSGITYSKDRILGRLLRTELLDVKELIIPPGQTITKEMTIRRGLSLEPTPVTLIFSSKEKNLSAAELPTASAVIGGAVDVDNNKNVLEVYFLIPSSPEIGRDINTYSFEFAIEEISPHSHLRRFDHKYSESFGPYAVKTDEGFLFIQQFTYDETRYQGEHIFTMKLFEDGSLIAQQQYTLVMG